MSNIILNVILFSMLINNTPARPVDFLLGKTSKTKTNLTTELHFFNTIPIFLKSTIFELHN
jgi:hypothetical protein